MESPQPQQPITIAHSSFFSRLKHTNKFILFVGILLILFIIGGLLVYLKVIPLGGGRSSTLPNDIVDPNQELTALPFGPHDKRLEQAIVLYNVVGLQISEVNAANNSISLKDPNDPSFVLSDISLASPSAVTEADAQGVRRDRQISDLRANMRVSVAFSYNIISDHIEIRGITIFPPVKTSP